MKKIKKLKGVSGGENYHFKETLLEKRKRKQKFINKIKKRIN